MRRKFSTAKKPTWPSEAELFIFERGRPGNLSILGGVEGAQRQEVVMNWDRIEGNWKQFSGKVKEKWGQLTDDDLAQANGNREQLEGILQKRYGYAKDQAKQELDRWSDTL